MNFLNLKFLCNKYNSFIDEIHPIKLFQKHIHVLILYIWT